MKTNQSGFIQIIVAIAALLVIGGGAYYASTKVNTENNVDLGSLFNNASSTEDKNANGNATVSLKSLLSFKGNQKCEVESVGGDVSSKGTIYISGEKMRSDFTSITSQGTINSSMIKDGETIYSWSGSNGAKMNINDMEKYQAKAEASAQANANVDLDQEVKYNCSDTSVDSNLFVVPSTVKFIDIAAMLNATTGVTGAGGSVDADALLEIQNKLKVNSY